MTQRFGKWGNMQEQCGKCRRREQVHYCQGIRLGIGLVFGLLSSVTEVIRSLVKLQWLLRGLMQNLTDQLRNSRDKSSMSTLRYCSVTSSMVAQALFSKYSFGKALWSKIAGKRAVAITVLRTKMSKLEVPRPDFITQDISPYRDAGYKGKAKMAVSVLDAKIARDAPRYVVSARPKGF